MVFRSRFEPVTTPRNNTDIPPGGFRIVCRATGEPGVEASDAAGAAYGRGQLEELRRSGALPEPPYCLEECPLFTERGFMLDISRCRVPRMEFLFDLVRRLHVLRYNQLQLYTEHTFAYPGHQTVWGEASPMTAEDIRALDVCCREHHIELVPNQNCFGHMERWLRHPAYRHLAECPDGFTHPLLGRRSCGGTLFPSGESAAFVGELLGHLLPLFSSGKVNIGGDEPWELGMGRSRGRVAEVGKGEVYREFLDRILGIALDMGKEPVFWADIVLEHPELVPRIRKEAVPAIWGYTGDHPFAEQCALVASAGFEGRFQVVPGTGTWNSFSGRLADASANIASAIREGRRHGARGMILTCWGDGGHHQPTPALFPALVLAARGAWGQENPAQDLAAAVDRVFYPDTPPGGGTALLELGCVDGLLPGINPNRSFLHGAFFADSKELPNLVAGLPDGALDAANEILRSVATGGLDPGIGLSRDLDQWALDRCLLQAGEAVDDTDMAGRLAALERTFREQWLTESRPGGLDESMARFPRL